MQQQIIKRSKTVISDANVWANVLDPMISKHSFAPFSIFLSGKSVMKVATNAIQTGGRHAGYKEERLGAF